MAKKVSLKFCTRDGFFSSGAQNYSPNGIYSNVEE
jgi:hypothetical protein